MRSGSIEKVPLPDDALLSRYRSADEFTDCYSTRIPFIATHSAFVYSFYTTWLFKIERALLGLVAGYPSTDDDAEELANGAAENFSAWRVEARAKDQLLLSDVRGRTRSWLMAEHSASGLETILYFGSAVVLPEDPRTGKKSMGWVFRALGGFHKLYSVLLLRSAARKLSRCAASDE